jgi:hypothetical protein
MLKLYAVSVASVLAAVLSASALGSAQVATPTSPVIVGKYEIRNADRGMSKRVKVFYDGKRIATIVLHRGAASYHCCTTEACVQVETLKACTTFKIACDADGFCGAG